ncbi:MAG: magnesium transporter [bacterium]
MQTKSKYEQPVVELVRKDFTALNKNLSVEEALSKIRKEGVGERIVYFYVVDDDQKLVGVLPTRRLLTGNPHLLLENIMVKRIAALPMTATVYDACEFFVTYKFLAFPVIDTEGKLLGIVDVSLFTEQLMNLEPDIDDRQQVNDIFETIGFNINEIKIASPFTAFRLRLPWLLATIASGTICATFAGIFEATLAESLVLAFFLTLILALGESVSIQAMTLTVQALHSAKPTVMWYLKSLWKETKTAILLGLSCGVMVFLIVFIWKHDLLAAIVIGVSVLLVEMIATFWGLSVPSILHGTKLDPKISAGPITLALTDVCTILFYLGLAAIVL